jgi:hypothetical protein
MGCSRQEWVNASDISLLIRFNYGHLDWLPGGSRMYGFIGLTSKSDVRSGGLPLRKAWHSSLPEDCKYQTNATNSWARPAQTAVELDKTPLRHLTGTRLLNE